MPEVHILAETASWLVLDKPAGLVVHDVPGEKHAGSTLVDWLKQNIPEIAANFPDNDSRPGIVHRLDADTSGAIIVAKDPGTLRSLQAQFKLRTTQKIYQALVLGNPGSNGIFTGAIGRVGEDTRHTVRRLSFSWEKEQPKPAETIWQTLKHLHDPQGREYTLVKLQPKTGRTHQLRVQLLDHATPIIGDPMYNTKASREASVHLNARRQLLHATSLTLRDPVTGKTISAESDLAPDIIEALQQLH